jgi:3-hydroxyacyl-[acyl-carrier-protein] dehydratase
MDNQTLDIIKILQTLPHRYPFLLVDRVLEIEPGRRIKAIKNVTANEPQFTGHWPDNPVMPGVLMLEAMAQAGGIMLMWEGAGKGKLPFIAGADNVRWRRQVRPGDQMIIETELLRQRGSMGKASAVVTVDGEIACEAEIMFALIDSEDD